MGDKPTYEELEQRVKELERETVDRKRVEEELLFKTTLLEAQSETSIDGVLVVDDEGKSILFNKRFGGMWNLTPEMLDRRDDEEMLRCALTQLKDPDEFLAKVRYLYTHKDEKSRDEIQFKDGKFFDRYSSPLIDSNGKYHGRIWYFRDITDYKRTQEELRESEEQYRGIFDSATDSFLIFDLNGNIVEANRQACQMYGYSHEELIKLSGKDIVHPDYYHLFEQFKRDVRMTAEFDYESVDLRGDGTTFNIRVRGTAFDYKGRPHLLAVIRDVTERKRAEEVLRESEERYRRLFNGINDAVFVHPVTKEGMPPCKFIEVNDVACQKLGYTREELLKLSHFDITAPEELENIPAIREKLLAGKHILFETVGVTKDGKRIPFEINIHQFDLNGHPTVLSIARDITDRKRAIEEKMKVEAQLHEAHRVEAIATLAGGIAHEFNNALVGISGNIELLQMDLPDNEHIDKYVKRMKNSTHRMASLTNQLLAYARGGKYQPKTVSLNDFVEDTVSLIRHSIDPTIRVETDLPGDISLVVADPTQMQMALSAVLNNASEAMEGEGRIRIITRDENIDEEFAETDPDLKPGPYVCLTIEDEGKGMDEETIGRVFDPFFTTKFQGRGLGMAAVYGIIKNHGGSISLDSELGKGTAVRIYLPGIASAQARQAGLPAVEVQVERPKESKTEVTTGIGTVLVIEDEDVVIDVIRTMLESMGYRVLVAKTGTEAVDIAQTLDEDIDLAILDIVLPDMQGKQVYTLIMEARPNLKVIVCSGYTVDGPGQEILDAGAQDFIQKPFSLETLSEKLNKVLGGHTGA